MGNRSPRHLKPGQKNLHGRRSKRVCPCCDPVIDHRQKVLSRQHAREITEATLEATRSHGLTWGDVLVAAIGACVAGGPSRVVEEAEVGRLVREICEETGWAREMYRTRADLLAVVAERKDG